MGAFRADGMVVIRMAIVLCMVLAGTVVRAADEEPVCHFLLQQIGFAAQKAGGVDDDVLQKAKYLERIALMEQSALHGPSPSSAGVFDAELARAQESLDAAKMRQDVARSAINSATTAFVQQCPQHFAAINGDYVQLAILVGKAMSDPSQTEPAK